MSGMTGMRAGAARVDITPPQPTSLAGYPPIALLPGGPVDHRGYTGRTGVWDGIHDAVYARALAVDDGERTAVIVAMDVCAVERRFADRVREAAAQRFGLDPDAFLLGASHNHSGPDYSGFWEAAPPGVEDYVRDAVVRAIGEALAARQPSRTSFGSRDLAGITINRRDPARPVDPRVPVLRFDALDGSVIGVVYSFACHPIVAGPANRLVSGEYPGTASRVVEQALGGVALFLNGCAGNINPQAFPYAQRRNIVDVARELRAAGLSEDCRTLGEVSRFGVALGGTVLAAAAAAEPQSGGDVRFWRRHVEAPVKQPAELEDFLTHVPHTREAADRLRSSRSLLTEVSVFRLGPMTLLALPGEPFVEIGLELEGVAHQGGKDPLGAVRAIGYANDYPGYLLPPEQYAENRYETVATALAAEGAEAIIAVAAEVYALADAAR
jgi:neutral ceramidase